MFWTYIYTELKTVQSFAYSSKFPTKLAVEINLHCQLNLLEHKKATAVSEVNRPVQFTVFVLASLNGCYWRIAKVIERSLKKRTHNAILNAESKLIFDVWSLDKHFNNRRAWDNHQAYQDFRSNSLQDVWHSSIIQPLKNSPGTFSITAITSSSADDISET